MKKRIVLLFYLTGCIVFCSCGKKSILPFASPSAAKETSTVSSPSPTVTPVVKVSSTQTPEPTKTLTPTPTPTPTRTPAPTPVKTPVPTLRNVVLTDLEKEQIAYFAEVAMKAEYGDNQNDGIIKKWIDPIRLSVIGTPTEEDMKAVKDNIAYFNSISGFPGMRLTNAGETYNILMRFMPEATINEISGIDDSVWGYATIWWGSGYRIEKGEIGIVSDVTNETQRKHCILEEMVQVLGLLNDSYLYEDSIFLQNYSEVTKLSAMDKMMIQMLYSSGLEAGMEEKQAFIVLEDWLVHIRKR